MTELSTKPRDQLALYRTMYQKSYKVSYKDKIRGQKMWLLLNIISLISMRSFFAPGSPHTKPYSGTSWSLWLTQSISKLISDLLFFLFVEPSSDKEKLETPSQKHIQVHTCIFSKTIFLPTSSSGGTFIYYKDEEKNEWIPFQIFSLQNISQ